jgi:DnaJ-class molecular chaperone
MTTVGEYYRVLGVALDAQTDDIKKAFRKLARTCHPDVAGDDPSAAVQFALIREAYETLVDSARRAEYDSRNDRQAQRKSRSHIRNEWRPPGGWEGFSSHSKVRAARRASHQKSDITMDDIFTEPSGASADFGFGTKSGGASRSAEGTAGASAGDGEITMAVDVPGRAARLGGTVTVRYNRLRRSSDGVNVYSYPEIHDLRVPPKTCTGDTLRSERMGNFSVRNNRYADLVCRITVAEESGTHHPRRAEPHTGPTPKEAPQPSSTVTSTTDSVRVSLVEAVLGGRVRVDTPKGSVSVTIPPGTSSGKTLRLKGKGADGSDWFVRIEIGVPKTVDVESRSLIERFGELNPLDPESQ